MDYNALIVRYDRLIKKFAEQYYRGVIPKDDYMQELRIRLWKKIDGYNSALGSIDNYAYGILNLEAKKIKSDMRAQDKFEENIILSTVSSDVNYHENNDYETFVLNIENILGDSEKNIFGLILTSLDYSTPVRYKKLASAMGMTIYELNKSLFNIRNKIRVFIDNEEFF